MENVKYDPIFHGKGWLSNLHTHTHTHTHTLTHIGKWQPTPVFLPGKFHRQRSLAGYSPWDHKESGTTEQLSNNYIYIYTHTHTHIYIYMKESECESRSVVSDSLRPHRLCSPRNSPGQNTGVSSLSLLHGIFPSQESNPGLLHCRQILYQLSHKGSLRILEWVAYPFSSGYSRPRN